MGIFRSAGIPDVSQIRVGPVSGQVEGGQFAARVGADGKYLVSSERRNRLQKFQGPCGNLEWNASAPHEARLADTPYIRASVVRGLKYEVTAVCRPVSTAFRRRSAPSLQN